MSDVVIRAEGLGKKYLIGHQAEGAPYATLRESIGRTLSRFRRNARDMAKGRALIMGDDIEEFWALKDVDFEIRRGEVVGIIGRNGAGKSTLLKVLSRITEPSEGRVTIDGRVASLLEVGTGFHPELSGRENIFLNGSILGMTRKEIQGKFDEIVDFAGVEKFIDTPVKRYSSGMQVRLGFAVAAHLEPEILIVDEVLAVGDAEFQKKCIGKMKDVSGSGKTVLFVSHNMAAVSRLCQTGIYLWKGNATSYGDIQSAQARYLSHDIMSGLWVASDHVVYDGFTPTRFEQTGPHKLKLQGVINEAANNLIIGIRIDNAEGTELFWTTQQDKSTYSPLLPGAYDFTIELPSFMVPGDYRASLAVFYHQDRYIIEPSDGPCITVSIPALQRGSAFFDNRPKTLVYPLIDWNYEKF